MALGRGVAALTSAALKQFAPQRTGALLAPTIDFSRETDLPNSGTETSATIPCFQTKKLFPSLLHMKNVIPQNTCSRQNYKHLQTNVGHFYPYYINLRTIELEKSFDFHLIGPL